MRSERQLSCRRCAALASAALADAQPFQLPGAQAVYAPDRSCDVRHIKAEVELDFAEGRVAGTCTTSLTVINDGHTRLELNAVEMTVDGVELSGARVPWDYDGKTLSIDLGERRSGEELELAVRYSAEPRRGLYFIRPDVGYPDRPVQAWTQGQDEDNRHWLPCFDHPHEKSTSEVIVTVPERMVALSNGNLLDEKHVGGKRVFHFRHDVPHSSYLITLVAGEFEVVTDKWEDIDVYYYVPHGRSDDARRALGRTPEMLRLFSEKTGTKYPYPRYSQITVAEFIFGGMENTSATTLTDTTLHDERAHLDFSSEPLVSHELAHQWFGDLLTCRDWSQGWLNEGFATYMEIVWKEHSTNRDEADYDRLGDMEAYLGETGHRYRRAVVTHVYHEPIDVFDAHLYEKGGCVLHMLRTQLGDDRFWKAIRHYVAKNARGSVETRDLARAVEDATGWNGDRFFEQWIMKSGHPELKVELSWDAEGKQARLRVRQGQVQPPTAREPEVPLFHLPVTVRFVVEGKDVDVKVTVQDDDQTFIVPLTAKPTQAIFDLGNHFLKTLELKKPDEMWKAELASAELGIDRVRAARALGKGADPTSIATLDKALRGDKFWAVRGESALALAQIKTEAARDKLTAALGNEKHPKARRLVVRALGAFRGDEGAASALTRPLAGDASYFVEAESAVALARTRSPRAFDLLKAAMHRPSYLDVVESSCLSGLAELRDERAIDVALNEVKYGRPVVGRRAAAAALGALGGEHGARKRQVREVLVDLLDDTDFRVRIAAVEALRNLGDVDAVGGLRKAERRDLDGRVRRRSREVARQLLRQTDEPATLRTLRDTVEKLESEGRELKERLGKLEAGPAKTGKDKPGKAGKAKGKDKKKKRK